ncbi:MAG: septum formation initiator family protein [bacterium]
MLKLENIKIKGFFLAITVLACFFSTSFIKETHRNYKINKEIINLKEDIELLHNENLELTKLINYLKTDNFVEKEARLKFGMKKDGEKAFVIEKSPSAKNGIKKEENILEASNLQKWQDFFFGSDHAPQHIGNKIS